MCDLRRHHCCGDGPTLGDLGTISLVDKSAAIVSEREFDGQNFAELVQVPLLRLLDIFSSPSVFTTLFLLRKYEVLAMLIHMCTFGL